MLEPALKPDFIPTSHLKHANREVSKHVRQSLARTLAQSVDLKDLAYEAAMELKLEASPEQEDGRRARCQAVAAAIKAWDMACDRGRVLRGKSLPGRAEPKAPKRKSAPQTFHEQAPE